MLKVLRRGCTFAPALKKPKGMTTLLTGATGFVGAAVLRTLIAAGHNIRALVRPNSDRRNLSGVDCPGLRSPISRRSRLSAVGS